MWSRRQRVRLGFLLLWILGAACDFGTVESGADHQDVRVITSALTNSEVMGFEVLNGWSTTTSGAVLSHSTTRSQGAFSLAVKPSNSNGFTPVASVPLSTLGVVSTMLAWDVMLPTQQPNPNWFGTAQTYLNCPSRNIYSQFLAQVELTGKPLNVWNTISFPLTNSLVSSLLMAGYSDLTITVVLNVQVPTTGTYRVDNLRFVPAPSNGCGGKPNGSACTDGNPCTVADFCQNGTCKAGAPMACTPSDSCHNAGTCSPSTGLCSNPLKPNGAACSDGNGCTQTDTCQSGTCTGANPKTCTALDQCHNPGTCVPSTGVCTDPPKTDGTPCLDGNICNGLEACQAGTCVAGPPPSVDDSNACTVDTCDPNVGAVHTAVTDGTPCLDGDLCNGSETCQTGACSAGTPISVDDQNSCTTDSCDPATGAKHTAIISTPPCEPAPQQEPATGPAFNGTLTGNLSVSPSGAAMYTVPISIPPGVAGMAPNLNLVYNSQAGNGIAGQGWELAGLSMIHRCQKTRVQNGHSRPIVMDSLVNPNPDDTDGICLDGQKLFETPVGSGNYKTERPDFGSISKNGDRFIVTTKSGETRYYGLKPSAQVVLPSGVFDPLSQTSSGTEVAVWALDKVVDDWGNFYELFYNNDGLGSFTQSGIRVTEIQYTGHLTPEDNETDVQPFALVKFTYSNRPDVRWVRFGASRIPRNMRLEGITTSAGVYSLTYMDELSTPTDADKLVASRLREIRYCAGTACLEPLVFDWTGGSYGWTLNNNFRVPDPIDGDANGAPAFSGNQLVDLNGDGRVDFVGPLGYYLNSGEGFPGAANATGLFPVRLSDSNGSINGFLADLDLDGLPDLVTSGSNPKVYFNKLRTAAPGWVEAPAGTFTVARDFGRGGNPDRMADMNGDGRTDLIVLQDNREKVYLTNSTGTDWVVPNQGTVTLFNGNGSPITSAPGSSEYFLPPGIYFNKYHLEDVNRDGLADFVANETSSTSGGNLFRWVRLNTGNVATGQIEIDLQFPQPPPPIPGGYLSYTTLWKSSRFSSDPGADSPKEDRFVGDIDGDGLHDTITISPDWFLAEIVTTCDFWGNCSYECPQNPGCVGELRSAAAKVALSTGVGYQSDGANSYRAILNTILASYTSLPHEQKTWTNIEPRIAFADVNADGLIDMMRVDGKQLWINNGTTWIELPDAFDLPAVPTRHNSVGSSGTGDNGIAFVDLNGDGAVDIARCSIEDGGLCSSWLNTFTPPAITGFPNTLAVKTAVTYTAITSRTALIDQSYTDSDTLAPDTTHANIPLRVVTTVRDDDGTGRVSDFRYQHDTTYRYRDLRASKWGRGSQGFRQVVVTDPSGMVTTTTFAQAYPYAGLPTDIRREAKGLVISETHTQYCDIQSPFDLADCTPPTGEPSRIGPMSFVYPAKVTDTTYLRTSSGGLLGTQTPHTVSTVTESRYDEAGNPVFTRVTSASTLGEKFVKTSINIFGTQGSIERRRGKMTESTVSAVPVDSSGSPGTAKVHRTQFLYQTFAPAQALGLWKKIIEVSAGEGIELHTAFDYDQFGNVITTTSCAANFLSCAVGAIDPAFRTTRVSYDPASFVAPTGTGLLTSIPYGKGRFPVKTTNALGHAEYTVHDPRFGVVQQKMGPNGISTCYGYNALGRQTSSTERCGSDAPVITTVDLRRRAPDDPALVAAVTITQPPIGGKTWAYTDVLGRTIQTMARGFDGGFTKTLTVYDSLGRVHEASKPFSSAPGSSIHWTITEYDPLNRPWKATQDLGDISGAGGVKKSVLTTAYTGVGPYTEICVGGTLANCADGTLQKRFEDRNLLGKVATVLDGAGSFMTYAYDADGNLTETKDPSNNKIQIEYDVRGRKIVTRDPDLGEWKYKYNGFGELKEQTDARGQITTMTYDALGRMTSKTDATGTAEWVYDVATGAGIGKLAAMVAAADSRLEASCAVPHVTQTNGRRAGRWFKYTQFGDVEEATECTDGTNFTTNYAYDAFGRQSTVRYPAAEGTQLSVGYHYTGLGYLHFVTDNADQGVLWEATGVNPLGQVTGEYAGNGVETLSNRNPSTGWLMGSASTAHEDGGKLIQDWAYRYDEVGNLRFRGRSDQVNVANSQETFGYDVLNRLTSSRVLVPSDNYDSTESFGYDALGNLATKDGQMYTYSGCQAGSRPAGPHAVCAVGSGSPFTYDGNGNMTSGSDRAIEYNLANKVTHIHTPATGSPTSTVDFIYGADGNRVVQVASGGGVTARTVYVGLGGTGKSLYERTTRGSIVEHAHFIYAGGSHGGSAFAVRVVSKIGTSLPVTVTRYHHFDHLGSVTAVSDGTGHVVNAPSGGSADPNAGVLGYDAWGARRDPTGRYAPPASFNLQAGHREFTGHEAIPGVGLVNMNGRVYDPVLGRFLWPDPTVQFAADLQSYNRYSYVLNNPLRYTDPTGYYTSPGPLFDFYVNVAITVAAVVVCVGTEGAGCGFAFAVAATVYNTTSMINSGVPWDQAVGLGMASLAVGFVAGSVGGMIGGAVGTAIGNAPVGQIVGGAIGSTLSMAMMAALSGDSLTGGSLLSSAVQGAFWSGVAWSVASSRALSQASAAEAQGEANVVFGRGGGAADEPVDITSAREAGRAGSVASQLAGSASDAARASVYDADAQRGAMLAGRLRQELIGPLAGKYRVVFVNGAATPDDVRGLGTRNVMVAVLGKGGKSTAMQLFDATGLTVDRAELQRIVTTKFSGAGGGVTLGRVAVVAAPTISFGSDTLFGNLGGHEFGHTISKMGPAWDHRTGGLMSPNIGTDDPILHFSPRFMEQFQ